MTLSVPGAPTISVGDVETVAISYVDWLDASENLTGTPTVTEETTTDLTISSVTVSTAETTILGKTVPASQAVLFSVRGQTTANSPYAVKVTVGTDASVARTAVRLVNFNVE